MDERDQHPETRVGGGANIDEHHDCYFVQRDFVKQYITIRARQQVYGMEAP